MTRDKELKRIFEAHRNEIPDDGFARRLNSRLPRRPSFLPQIVIVLCAIIGTTLTIAIQGVTTIIENISGFFSAIIRLQMPSTMSMITYFSMLALIFLISFSVAKVDAE
jgi:hypothetical protein